MRIAYYMPFKPMGHPHPSGDLAIGTGLFRFLATRDHDLALISRLRTRWIYWKPWLTPAVGLQMLLAARRAKRFGPDLWLTYHTYYKAPDLLGPACARHLNIPYVIFQGIYATRPRKHLKTRAGYYLNRTALLAADAVFTNKRLDYKNLERIIPPRRLHYVTPGIVSRNYNHDPQARQELRAAWNSGETPVIMTAAMFRPGVKSRGLEEVIRVCGQLHGQGLQFQLVLVGDGENRGHLQKLARRLLPAKTIFTGRIPPAQMHRYYSAADLFVFPGYEESLGMVYLEAQACGLPVVAYGRWGAKEVVRHAHTGLLATAGSPGSLANSLSRLLNDSRLRTQLGTAAKVHVAKYHDLESNYAAVEAQLKRIVENWYRKV